MQLFQFHVTLMSQDTWKRDIARTVTRSLEEFRIINCDV